MIVLVRADATLHGGMGHVMRCAALGMRLCARGIEVHFVCAELPRPLEVWLQSHWLHVHMLLDVVYGDWCKDLRQTAEVASGLGRVDLLVVDHYGLGRDWESGMRKYAHRILVVDDLADRDHDCDLLLDQNLREDASTRYTERLPPGTRQFIGPRYALLRVEFDDPALSRQRDGVVRRLLVFFGGTDPGNQNIKLIDALRLLGGSAPMTTLVLGQAHPDRKMVRNRALGLRCLKVLDATDSMADLMMQADLAIGTCGVAAWERCALGLPSLVVVTAENQREDAEILHAMGALRNLGDAEKIDASYLAAALHRFLDDPAHVMTMGISAANVMAGRAEAFAELEEALLNGGC